MCGIHQYVGNVNMEITQNRILIKYLYKIATYKLVIKIIIVLQY